MNTRTRVFRDKSLSARSAATGVVEGHQDIVQNHRAWHSFVALRFDVSKAQAEEELVSCAVARIPHRRELQLEAKAHITVQKWIDEGGLSPLAPTAVEALLQIHRRFGERLPPEHLWVEDPKTHERLQVVPGQLRSREVQVGRHVAISPGARPEFLDRFALVYGRLRKSESILAAAAHHRLVWIHPFLDGNGRVARLMSHAQLLNVLDSGAVWYTARGLARKVETYKYFLANI